MQSAIERINGCRNKKEETKNNTFKSFSQVGKKIIKSPRLTTYLAQASVLQQL